MNPQPIVGLLGKKRSGKDTFASYLVEDHGFQRFAFADPLKSAALELDPVVGADWSNPTRLSTVVSVLGWEEAKERAEVRGILQRLGTAMRGVNPSIWLDATMVPALAANADGHAIVISDVRFHNEATAIREAGGVLVRVERPGLTSTDPHVSETLMDSYEADAVVANALGLESLRASAHSLAHYLGFATLAAVDL